MYKVVFTQEAERGFQRLEKPVQERIVHALNRLLVNPKRSLESLVGLPYYKFRAGDYRLIIKLDESEKIIYIMKTGHRKNVYKNFNF